MLFTCKATYPESIKFESPKLFHWAVAQKLSAIQAFGHSVQFIEYFHRGDVIDVIFTVQRGDQVRNVSEK